MKILPEQLILITDPNHPDYDPRVTRPINEERVQSILKFGVTVPIKVKSADEGWVVVDGRGRTKDAIEANRRIREKGGDPILVECVEEFRENVFEAAIVSNTLRDDDNPLQLAEKMRKYQLGKDRTPPKKRTLDEIGVAFGKHRNTVIAFLSLLMLHEDIQQDLRDGTLKMSEVVSWTKRDLDTQLKLWHDYKKSAGKVEGDIEKPKTEARRVVPGSAGWYYDNPVTADEPEAPEEDDRKELEKDIVKKRWTRNHLRLKGLSRPYMKKIISTLEELDIESMEPDYGILLDEVKHILKWVVGDLSNKEICQLYPPLEDFVE